MPDCTPNGVLLSDFKRRVVEARFDGGAISSDGGSLLLREVERRTGLLHDVSRRLTDARSPRRCVHDAASLLRQHAMRRGRVPDGVEHSMPAKVVVGVAGRDAMKARHPCSPSAVIGVDVLHVKRGSSDANALGDIDRLMLYAAVVGRALIQALHR